MTTILIHCGMPKTGTTVLQRTLSRSSDDLLGEGVLYPRTGRGGSAHHLLAAVLREGDRAEAARLRRRIEREIAATEDEAGPLRRTILSSEGLTNLCGRGGAGNLAAFIDGFSAGHRVGAVIYLREIVSFLESMYCQIGRARAEVQPFDSYLRTRRKRFRDFLAGLRMLRAALGDRFTVALAGPGYNVLTEFDRHLGLPPGWLARHAARPGVTSRPSLKKQIAMTHRHWLEEQLGFRIDAKRLSAVFDDAEVFGQDVTRYTLYSRELRQMVVDEFLPILRESGFADYAALTEAAPPADAPHFPIDPSVLTSADLAALAALRPRLEAPA